MENKATISYRPYANFNNTFLQTIDLFLSHSYYLGKVSESVKERSSTVMVGLSLGLMGLSIDTEKSE